MIKKSKLKPFDPKLAMAIRITFVTLMCIVMFVIIQARHELHDALMPLKAVSEIEHPDSIGSDLVKRN